jgi:glycyl-tRNA synthetase beta chain
LDKLAGYLGLGLEPTGSSDPFGLRRAATILIEAAWKWHGPLPGYDGLFREALELYRREGHDFDESGAERALADLFASRYEALMPEVRHDVLEGAMLREYTFELLMPRRVRLRAQMLGEMASDTGFVQAATRPINIVSAARKKGVEYAFEDPLAQTNADALDSEAGRALLALLKEQEDPLFRALRDEDGSTVVALVRTLEQPIHRFFESTMVMVDDPAVRYARLSLLHACCLQLLHVGDFSKLEG